MSACRVLKGVGSEDDTAALLAEIDKLTASLKPSLISAIS